MKNSIPKLILNLLYPPRCIFCGERLSPKAKIFVCTDCSNNLPYCKAYNRCKSCGNPIPEGQSICRRCYISPTHTIRSTSSFIYMDNARSAIIAMKKSINAGNARVLSFYVAGMVKNDFPQVEFDGVISVPPRRRARKKDGYDQAAALGREVAKRLSLPYIPHALHQTRRIKKQSTLTFEARVKNVKGAFGVKRPDAIKGKTLLLIDDVRTSGATLNECAKTLMEAGAFKVYSATAGTAVL